ncbi:hypothetical protein DID88_004825 [Monilinia fructigena]|uniref:PUM-HD domain-containing protein n=1 Tax=Monilinia fructigena TaxID=38457 RepID=A0A395IPL5_9HELO|nr:hypothetical protein DID88_004825 [Monilinia fructigena]
MSSAAANRPTGTMNTQRSARFGDFSAAPGRNNSDDRTSQSSTLGQTFGNGGTWQPSSDIWGSNTIGSGFANTKRDSSRSRAADNDGFRDAPSGSGALAASSEADPWVARANGPWNPPDTTSPTLQSSHSGSASPSHVRNSIPSQTPQSLLELQTYQNQDLLSDRELVLVGKFAGFGLTNDIDQANISHINNASSSSYSPTHQNFGQQAFQANGGSAMWNDGSSAPKALSNYDNFSNQTPFADQGYFSKSSRFDRGSVSPASSDYRHLPTELKSGPKNTSRPKRTGPQTSKTSSTLSTRPIFMAMAISRGNIHHIYTTIPHKHSDKNNVPPYGYPMPLPPFPSQNIPTRPAKDHDVGLGVRSVLLEEFRSNAKSNKRYELKDIYQHVVEFSGDQHGSRFIQQKLETANSDEKRAAFQRDSAKRATVDDRSRGSCQDYQDRDGATSDSIQAQVRLKCCGEESIQFGSVEQRHTIVSLLTALHSDGTSPLQLMMKDQYGNYVIQKLLGQLKGAERIAFVDDLKPQLLALKKYNYGKQIAAIEKLIYGPDDSQHSFVSSPTGPTPGAHTQPIEINSSAPTPLLTNGQNSPQSSSLPSANVSTIDDPTDSASSGKTAIAVNEKSCPRSGHQWRLTILFFFSPKILFHFTSYTKSIIEGRDGFGPERKWGTGGLQKIRFPIGIVYVLVPSSWGVRGWVWSA